MNDGKLEPRAKKYIFIGYASGVKGYRLWCTDLKSPGYIINRDVIFNEPAKLHPKEDNIESTEKEDEISKKVELEIKGSYKTQENTLVQPNTDMQDFNLDDDDVA